MKNLNDLAGRYISFTLGNEKFAIPLLEVKEVIGNIDITPIPQSPPYYEGVMNLRGQIIPVIDLRKKLGIKKAEQKEMTIIILDFDSNSLGIIVDSIESVNTYEAQDISLIEKDHLFIKSEFILGVAKKDKLLTMILHLQPILHISEYQLSAKANLAA